LAGPAIAVRGLDPPLHLPVALVWRRRTASPAAKTFIDFACGPAA